MAYSSVDDAAEFRLAFDIYDALFSHIGFGRDARRSAKGEFADLVNRQGIDLSDYSSAHVDHDAVIQIGFMHFLFIEIVAEAMIVKGFDDVFIRHLSGVALAGPVILLL